MKKSMIAALVAAAMAVAGCHTAHVKVTPDGGWEADLYDNMISRDIKSFTGEVKEGGQFKFALNGYQSDVSEQLPAFTREMWQGVALGMRLGLTAASPAVATVPLTTEAADANAVAQAVSAQGQARAQVLEAKAKLKAAQREDGSCGEADCSTCTR